MSTTNQVPNTVLLAGQPKIINDVPASAAITPGHLVERHSSSGSKFRKHATAGGNTSCLVALNTPMLNKGIDDAYASGDLVEVAFLQPGDLAYMLLASGESVVPGDKLESNGDGTLRKLTSGTPLFNTIETVNNTAGPSTTRIRAEAF